MGLCYSDYCPDVAGLIHTLASQLHQPADLVAAEKEALRAVPVVLGFLVATKLVMYVSNLVR